MFSISWRSVALKWNTFFSVGGAGCFVEYIAVFMKQLGLNSFQIGITGNFGVSAILAMIPAFLADRLRARKHLMILTAVLMVLFSLAPLLPLQLTSLQVCKAPPTDNQSGVFNVSLDMQDINNKNVFSPLFLFMFAIKMMCETLRSLNETLNSIAIHTYNKTDKAKYGSYYLWGQIGAGLSLFSVGIIASATQVTLCGKIENGYFVALPFAAIMIILSLIAVPWIDFEYLELRVINWSDVKQVTFKIHYILMLLVGFWCGWCFSFQYNWEYWYIDYLSGGPDIMAFGALIRRPFVAASFAFSVDVIEKLGDIKTIVVAILAYSVSFLGLAFVGNPWLVLVVDIFQAVGFAFSFSALNVHFSKVGTKASTAVTMALMILTWLLGEAIGSTITGWLFMSFGPRLTLFYYAIISGVVLAFFAGYILTNKGVLSYEIVRELN